MKRTEVESGLAVANEAAADGSVAIAYARAEPLRVQGLTTGQVYEFSSLRRVQPVDTRDAQALLNTRFFRRA